MTDVSLILGMKVRLDRRVDRELGCHDNVAIIREGRGPHYAQLLCVECHRHRGWLPHVVAAFLTKTVRSLGVPNGPFLIRDAKRQGAHQAMNRAELYPSRFLKHADLKGRTCTVVIDQITLEDVDEEKQKPVLHFKYRQKGLVLNATNYDLIADSYGDETDDWAGQPIELYPTRVPFKGKLVDAIRVRIPTAKAEPPKPVSMKPKPEIGDSINDEVSF
jgi:hypothetical protein